MIICFLGPEGSGKGTQAELLSQKLGIPHIVSGDILRGLAKEQSKWGDAVRKAWEAHEYLPDDAMTEIYLHRLEDKDCANGFVADGFPRSIAQAEALDNFLAKNSKKINYAILLNISEDETFRRLASRGRFDDTPEGIKNRLKSYHDRIDGVITYYKNQGNLQTIDGERSIETVQQDIEAVVNNEK